MKKLRYKKHQERQFQRKRFDNPYFSKKKKNGFIKNALVFIGTSASILGIGVFFIWLPILSVDNVSVSGTITTPPTEIEKIAWTSLQEKKWGIFPRKHRWFNEYQSLAEQIDRQFSFAEINIERDGQTLRIHIQETVSAFIWARGERLYYINQEGVITRQLTEEESNDVRAIVYNEGERLYILQTEELYVIFDAGTDEVSQNISVLPSGSIGGLEFLVQALEKEGVDVDGLIADQHNPFWITIRTKAGFELYIDLIGEMQSQVENFLTVLQERDENLQGINYIDLRFGNRVFVK